MSGWIKLHRSLIEWEWYDDVNTRLVFIHCLLQANFKDRSHKGTMFERGSFPCGRDQLAKDVGITTQQLRTSIRKLTSTGEITIKSTSKGTKITLCNYEGYQDVQPADQPTSNQQVTNNQPASNHSIRRKEGKKVIKEDKDPRMDQVASLVKRRESTKWSDKEIKQLKKLDPSQEDIDFLINKDYSNYKYRRRDLITLLNNWSGELDKMNTDIKSETQNNPYKSILD